MKYLAIFKDSLREAKDLKIFYPAIGISLLLSLLIFSVSYRPVPVEEMIEANNKLFLNTMTEMKHPLMHKLNFEEVKHVNIEEFKRLDEGSEPWTGNYRFVLDLELWEAQPTDVQPKNDDDKGQEKVTPPPAKAKRLNSQSLELPLMFAYRWVDKFAIRPLPSTDPKRLRFDVQTIGMNHGYRTRAEWFHQPSLFFGLVDVPLKYFKLEQIVRFVGNYVIGTFGAAVTMLLSCIVTAFFIPNMLAKGTVDLLLVKPIGRVTLFIYKFLGGMTFMLLNTAVIMIGVWAGFGLQSGYWVNGFLLCIPVFAFQFLIFYSASALAGVLTRSPIVSILTVIVLWGLFSVVGFSYWYAVEAYNVQNRPSGEFELEPTVVTEPPQHWAIAAIEVLHAVFPRYKDLDWLTAKEIKAELTEAGDPNRQETAEHKRFQTQVLEREFGTYTWGPTIGVSALFIFLVVGLATVWFATRDY